MKLFTVFFFGGGGTTFNCFPRIKICRQVKILHSLFFFLVFRLTVMTSVVRILTRCIAARSVLSYTPCCYRVWDQCNVVQDYLTVYDGAATTDPVLVRLCGGDVVPDIVSSGPNMLLEFHTSPFDNPFHPVPLSYLPGFELEVQVRALVSASVRPSGCPSFHLRMHESVDFIICP